MAQLPGRFGGKPSSRNVFHPRPPQPPPTLVAHTSYPHARNRSCYSCIAESVESAIFSPEFPQAFVGQIAVAQLHRWRWRRAREWRHARPCRLTARTIAGTCDISPPDAPQRWPAAAGSRISRSTSLRRARRVPPPRQQRDQGPARAHDVEPREELVVPERQSHAAGDDELERERHGWARARLDSIALAVVIPGNPGWLVLALNTAGASLLLLCSSASLLARVSQNVSLGKCKGPWVFAGRATPRRFAGRSGAKLRTDADGCCGRRRHRHHQG